ncbi:alpha-1,3-arabinosyltransferase XAT3-like isoform X2 [Neltuma alba]|uniref:alpha-1,3-arabinosyltransferase XAT3-like isoform X2 n=1 Tax=Neltuma alba TaxID=207710 RepID=UPI0010A50389|nr:alpha-1,3-arabinosyltransferase XAT3-like isoform X2 [Prosopis alba]
MMYDSIFSRSFNKHEQRRLKYGAFVSCFLLFLSLCTVFKPYLGPIQALNLRLSVGDGVKMRMVSDTPSSPKIAKVENIVANIIVNDSRSSSQVEEVEAIEPKILVNDTSSSSPVNEDKDIIIKVPVNDTSNFPRVAEGSEAEEDKSTKIPVNDTGNSHIQTDPVTKKEESELVCTSEVRTDFCESRGDIRVQGSSSTVYVVSPETSTLSENMSKIVKPYARKGDAFALTMVREWSVKPLKGSKQVLQCSQNHSVPAILFSTGGYAGNHFHDFTDILIPIFLTSRKYNGEVQFLVTNYRAWWLSKYQVPLKKLSNYEFIDINKDDQVHCFPSVTVGLKRYEKELRFDPLKHSYSMKNFRDFLRSSYSLKRDKAVILRDGQNRKPRLLIITRKRTRSFTNLDQIAKMAKRLGFEVITMEGGGNLSKFAEIVNSCDVVMGVHGAGLTNIVFLPENAVFIQIVPYGGVDWLAKQDFGLPSKEMNLKYLEYNIKVEESTLIQQYPPDHAVLKDPSSIKGWAAFRSVYLEKQNVKLDVDRFRPTLQKALELLHE